VAEDIRFEKGMLTDTYSYKTKMEDLESHDGWFSKYIRSASLAISC
jgi:hypothetical protein